MAKTLFEQLGCTYKRQNNYLVPHLTLPTEEENPIGIYGQRHLLYLKEHRRITYINLLSNGKLGAYLSEIDKQAQERFEILIKQMKQKQGITEQLKLDNWLEWIRQMNSICNQVDKLILDEIIYS